MACKTSCKLCPHLVLSQSVTFDNDTLTINIPAGAYQNGEKYCIVVAQSISDYCQVAKRQSVDTPGFYADMAKAFLEDADAADGKAYLYWDCIADK